MPYQRPRPASREHAPADRLTRAISDIDKQLELLRLADEPAPLSAYRARRILKEAQARCRDGATRTPAFFSAQAARPDAMPMPHRSRRDPVERYEALPGLPPPPSEPQDFGGCSGPAPRTNLRVRESDCDANAYEGTDMAYDWTGETTRKYNRVKLAAAVLLSLVIVLAITGSIASAGGFSW